MRKYDHIFFDLDNTLWDFTSNSKVALKLALEHFELLYRIDSFDDFLEIYEEINSSLWEDYRNNRINKQVLISERFLKSLNKFNISDIDPEELNKVYLDKMAEQKQLFDGTIETLEKLKGKGYQMHIITNGFKEVQTKKIKNSALNGFINKVFISETIQIPKPDKRIFEYALKSTNASKKKSIMVGDSWEVDIIGALKFGIDQILFNKHTQAIPLEIQKQLTGKERYMLLKNNKTTSFFIKEINDLIQIL